MKNYLRLMIVPLFSSAGGVEPVVHGMLPWAVTPEQVYAIVPELEKMVEGLDAAVEGMQGNDDEHFEIFMILWEGWMDAKKRLAEAREWIMHHEDREADKAAGILEV